MAKVPDFISESEELTNLIETECNCELNILGDININWGARNDLNVKRYKSFVSRAGLKNLIQCETSVDTYSDVATAIDHFSTSYGAIFDDHCVVPLSVTGHFMIFYGTEKV